MNEWKIGDVILDTYEVKHIHEGGGMGLVYRVYHRGWKVDLAVKSPRPEYFRNEQQKENFSKECETWIGLGLHPNIVSCHYVRQIEGALRVFAEYAKGGSLKDWISLRKLYQGDQEAILRRILDVAIQMVWGLRHAHEKDVVHQDVKPANVMMTPDGMAMISDFGLAKARAATSEGIERKPNLSVLVSSGGMTPAYCSPEQVSGQLLTRRTDIWSWAISVYEMFVGEVTWSSGMVVPEALEVYLRGKERNQYIPKMPPELGQFLLECLRISPGDRPHDFVAVDEKLNEIYRSVFHTPFQRALPERQELGADSINNRIISLVDLGAIVDPPKQNVLALLGELRSKKPDHIYGRINDALIHWRIIGQSIRDLNRQLDNIYSNPFMPDLLEWQIALELEKCDIERAQALLNKSTSSCRESLAAEVSQQYERIRSCLDEYFRSCGSIPNDWRKYYQYNEDASNLYAAANPQSGIVASGSNDGQVEVRSLLHDRVVRKIDVPHRISEMALSESGKYIACVYVEPNLGDASLECGYVVSVYSINDGKMVGTCAGRIRNCRLKAITIDDQCKRLTVWLGSNAGQQVFELEFELSNGVLKPFRCDFRKPSARNSFDSIYIDGEGVLLMGVSRSRCFLWRYPSVTTPDGINVLDVDLADYSLTDNHGQLLFPGIPSERGFNYQINRWNAYSLMRILNRIPPPGGAEYLLSQPHNSLDSYAKISTRANLLLSADCAEKQNERIQALSCLNRYCDLAVSYEEPIMNRRHQLAQALEDVHIERVWHHETDNQYWQANVLGLRPSGDNRITVHGWKFLETRSMSCLAKEDAGDFLQWCDVPDSKVYSVGVQRIDAQRAIVLPHLVLGSVLVIQHGSLFFKYDHKASLALYDFNDGLLNPKIVWRAPFDMECKCSDILRRVAFVGETVLVAIGSAVVEALDIQTVRCVGRYDIVENISFIQSVCTEDGRPLVVVCAEARAVLLDKQANFQRELVWGSAVAKSLRYIAAVAEDLSSIIGVYGSNSMVHVRLKDEHITEVWNRYDWVPAHEPRYITLSPCGRAVAYLLWDQLLVVDIATGRPVLKWRTDMESENGLSFDGSGRWLILAHDENKFDVFQLYWNSAKVRKGNSQ